MQCKHLGLARTIYMRCIYDILAGESPNIRSYTMYIYIRFWPSLQVSPCEHKSGDARVAASH